MGNRPVISKEQILDAAYEIATTKGLGALSIRAVAAACGVAVGTVYNSYPTKSDLVNDVVGRFWQRAFSDRMGAVTAGGVAGLEEGGAGTTAHADAGSCASVQQADARAARALRAILAISLSFADSWRARWLALSKSFAAIFSTA